MLAGASIMAPAATVVGSSFLSFPLPLAPFAGLAVARLLPFPVARGLAAASSLRGFPARLFALVAGLALLGPATGRALLDALPALAGRVLEPLALLLAATLALGRAALAPLPLAEAAPVLSRNVTLRVGLDALGMICVAAALPLSRLAADLLPAVLLPATLLLLALLVPALLVPALLPVALRPLDLATCGDLAAALDVPALADELAAALCWVARDADPAGTFLARL